MRVLIAYDASAGAEDALALAGMIPWRADTILRIVGVVEYETSIPPVPRAPMDTQALYVAEVIAFLERKHTEAAARVRGDDVQTAILRGRPATALVDHAGSFAADLVVVGSRGHGTIASLLLGSVSAEVVDHAPCPVLVVRRTTRRRVVLATDGSPAARAAEELFATTPIFDGLATSVVCVAETGRTLTSDVAPLRVPEARATRAGAVDHAAEEAKRIAKDSADRLRSAGVAVEIDVRQGDPAAAIIAAVEEQQADLVAIGSRGRTGLTRMMLGSVARDVLHGTSASVLVVRAA